MSDRNWGLPKYIQPVQGGPMSDECGRVLDFPHVEIRAYNDARLRLGLTREDGQVRQISNKEAIDQAMRSLGIEAANV